MKSHGTGNSTEMVYRIEARSTFYEPGEVNGMILDNRWRNVSTSDSPVGVKNRAEAARQGFLSYGAALTLAYWFLANADRYCIEVRLVKIKFVATYTTEEVGVSNPISSNFENERDFEERDTNDETQPKREVE